MLQKFILALAVFIVILLALTFGETIAHDVFAWLSHLSGLVIHNFSDVYYAIKGYLSVHTTKVLIALALTVPISMWIIRNKSDELNTPHSHRKLAIVLAIFLGWLGAHRFYQGQIGWGVVFLIMFYFFAPLAVVLGFIDAIRYMFMSDDEFGPARV